MKDANILTHKIYLLNNTSDQLEPHIKKRYIITEKDEVLTLTPDGSFDMGEILKINRDLDRRAERFRQPKLLCDFRGTRLTIPDNILSLELSSLVDEMKIIRRKYDFIKVCFIPGSSRDSIIAKAYSILSKTIPNYQFRVIKSYDEGMEWLNA